MYTLNFEVAWPLVLFSAIAGAGGALAAFVGLSHLLGKVKEGRFIGSLVALALFVIGGCCSVAHLALPQNMMAAATNIFSFSGVSVELIMLGLSFVVVAVYAILIKREAPEIACKVFAVLSIICGLVLAFVCGHGYVIESRQYWDTNLLPLAYLGTSLPLGGFIFVVIASIKKADATEIKGLAPWIIAATAISIVTTVAYMIFCGADVLGRDIVTTAFAICICGIVGIIACTAAFLKVNEKMRTNVAVFAIVLALIGSVGVRVLMWNASDPFFNAWYIEQENAIICTDDY